MLIFCGAGVDVCLGDVELQVAGIAVGGNAPAACSSEVTVRPGKSVNAGIRLRAPLT